MSIYSGFATRQQQQTYDQSLEAILYLFQKRLLKFYKNQPTDEDKFLSILLKLFNQMKSMQNHKYLQPKSSRTIQQLVNFLKNKQVDNYTLDKKIIQVQELQDSSLYKQQKNDRPSLNKLVPSQSIYDQAKSQKLQKLQSETYEVNSGGNFRLKVTNRKPMPKINNLSFQKNQQENNFFAQKQKVSSQEKQRPLPRYRNVDKKKQVVDKIELHKMINQSAPKLIKISRNQPRTFLNNSQQQIKFRKQNCKSNIKLQEKYTSENTEQQTYQCDKNSDVQQLIKGYISKTKKSYMKKFNKRRQQIQQMLKFL